MMQVTRLDIAGLFVFEPRVFADERGAFFESFNATRFREATGLDVEFVQDNHSISKQGVVRGLHYQLAPHAQGKLVRVVTGAAVGRGGGYPPGLAELWQVGRGGTAAPRTASSSGSPPGSRTGSWRSRTIRSFSTRPRRCGTGPSERAIRWDDPALAIGWPMPGEAIVSGKDAVAPLFADADLPQPGDHR